MAGGIPVMSEFQWARIVAKAYLDGTTGDLEKDPKQFVDGVRRADDPPGMKNLPDPVRLLNIDYSLTAEDQTARRRMSWRFSRALTRSNFRIYFIPGTSLGGQSKCHLASGLPTMG